MQIPVPVSQTPLALWLAALTPVAVAALGVVQIYVAKVQGKKINDIHTFTNSALGNAYRTAAIALRLLADHTHSPGDIRAAEQAEQVYQNHEATQQRINSGSS